ncbi:MAG: hypothetical protein L0216_17530 [Planctomycetales bacterium]|nr:hypothetical protein [Planctomycetales bacterium]
MESGADAVIAGTVAAATRARRIGAAIIDPGFGGGRGEELDGQLREVNPGVPVLLVSIPVHEAARPEGEAGAERYGDRLQLGRVRDLLSQALRTRPGAPAGVSPSLSGPRSESA